MVADGNTRLLPVTEVPTYDDNTISTHGSCPDDREENAPLLQRYGPLTNGADPDVFRGHGDERDETELEPGPALCLDD